MDARVKLRQFAWALAAIVLAAFFGMLGQWQLGRASEKESMIAAVERAASGGTQVLTAALGSGRPVRIAARGRFDPAHEVLLDNQTVAGRVGVRVLTPFRVDEPAAQLIIDRGWLPIDPVTRRPATVAAPPAGTLEIQGLLTALPGVGVRMGDAGIDSSTPLPLLPYLDQSALRDAFGAGLVDGLLRLDPGVPGGFLRAYQPTPAEMPPARHRGYAVQWFALAVTVIVTWLVLAFRRK